MHRRPTGPRARLASSDGTDARAGCARPHPVRRLPEIARYLIFRDRLRTHAGDRLLYESVKRCLATQSWPDMNAYAQAKSEVVEQIIARARQALEIGDGAAGNGGADLQVRT
jgi:GrpB-like predicted nucleotidyltransferase (UPF0157 family)